MIPPAIPSNEAERLQALRDLALLDTAGEERFDRLTRLAQRMFGTSMALVSFIDADRQWFKSRQGLTATETPRSVSICGHAILDDAVFVVPDTTQDPRFADNPLVVGRPEIRFYAGAPLRTGPGVRVGTLCVLDSQPLEWDEEKSAALRDLADLVELEINQARLADQQRALMTLSTINGLTRGGRKQRMREALRLGCEYLGAEMGIISRIENERYEVVVQHSPAGRVVDGEVYDLAETYCQVTMAKGDVVAIPEMSKSALAGHPSWERFTLESYVGVPLEVSGSPYGTVVFASREPRTGGAFTTAEQDFVRLLGHWVSGMLERWQGEEALVRQQRMLRFTSKAQASFILRDVGTSALEGLLEDILRFTDCEFGVIGEVLERPDGTPYLSTRALTNIAWNDQTRELYASTGGVGIEFDRPETLIGALLTSGEPVIANDPYSDSRSAGLPANHPPMASYLGLPVYRAGRLKGMLGLANRPGGFTRDMIDYLEPVLVTIGQLLEAQAVQREHRADQKVIARLSLVASQMTNGVIITDRDGCIEWANDEFVRMMGYAREALVGLRPRNLFHGPGTSSATEQQIRQAMEHREAFSVELLAYTRSGAELWLALQANPLTSPEGEDEGFVVMATDISERKRIDQMKTQFISTVSHELRTPLTAIQGALGLMAGGVSGEMPPRASAMIDIAQKNAERLATLINDLLDMEKLVEGGLPMACEVQELLPIVGRAIDDNATYASRFGVSIELSEWAEGVRVDVDSLRLIQVLSNLLSNACKFAPRDSVVTVSVHEKDDRVLIGVTDLGPGVPDSFREVMFDKFTQADSSDTRSRGGTGLGLAISRELTERMGGGLRYEHSDATGTTFTIELPAARPEESDD